MNHIFNVEVAVEHGVEVAILAERMGWKLWEENDVGEKI